MIKLMRAGHMLLAGGKKPKIHLDATPKKKNYSIMKNFRKPNYHEFLLRVKVLEEFYFRL